jgi:hypothetical protein
MYQFSVEGSLYRGEVAPETAKQLRDRGVAEGIILERALYAPKRFQLDLRLGQLSVEREPSKLFELTMLSWEVANGSPGETHAILNSVAARKDLETEDHVIFFKPGTALPDAEMISVGKYLTSFCFDLSPFGWPPRDEA